MRFAGFLLATVIHSGLGPAWGAAGKADRTPLRVEPSFRFFKAMVSETSLQEENYALYPKTFSATGFFTDMATKEVGPGMYLFEINSPLWSDGSSKSRYLVLPKDSVITYVNDTDEYVFPEGAVFVKHFTMDTLQGNPASRIFIETRILVRQFREWHGFSYKWRKDQGDADLVGAAVGGRELDSFYVKDASGKPRKKKWLFPARLGFRGHGPGPEFTNCNTCHINSATGRQRGVLGFITPQLARLVDGKDAIQDLMDKGYLVGKAGAVYVPGTAHRWYALDDSTNPGSTLEKRARSYLASNCSHCHSPEGENQLHTHLYLCQGGCGNELYGQGEPGKMGRGRSCPGFGQVGFYPGKPEYSVILSRISAADADGYRDLGTWDVGGMRRTLAKRAGWDGNGLVQMPPLATYETNPLADRVIHDWIKSLPAGTTGTAVGSRKEPAGPGRIRISQGRLYLPGDMQDMTKAILTDMRGRSILLPALRGGVFSVPHRLPNGIYGVSAGGRRFTVAYFPAR